jgi:hypothetical protein
MCPLRFVLLRFCALALLCVCFCQACQSPPATDDQRASPTDVAIRTDLTLLAERITLPSGIQSARWSVVPVGSVDGAAPGPTDTRLYAFLQPRAAATANLRLLGPDEQHQTSAAIPPNLARALLPPETAIALQPDPTGDLVVPGDRYDATPFARGVYRGVYAVQTNDGLLVCLQTR